MEENSQLEEGEAGSYNDDGDKNVNPDIDFSYIDEKMHNVLGHFQKDFEGCVITENLGAKFGEYGSFLPTSVRAPHLKTLHRSSNTPKSPNKFLVEDTSKISRALSSLPPSEKHVGNILNNTEVIKRDISSQKKCGVSSPLSSQKSDMLEGKSGPQPNNKGLKFRLKVVPNCMEKKRALICSGLGLDNSPSSSLGNNIEGYSGDQLYLHNIEHHSPTSIIQVMTTFPVPGDFLLSPFDDSLLRLIGKQIMPQDSECRPYHKAVQGHSAVFSNGAVSALSDSKVSKHKEKNSQRKNDRGVGSELGNDAKFENDTQFYLKKNMQSENTAVTDILPDNFKRTSFVNKVSSSDSVKACETVSKVAKEVNSNPSKNNLFSSTLVENSLEVTFGQDNCENEKKHAESSSFVRGLEHTVASIDNHMVKPSGSGRCKSNRNSKPSKIHSSKIKYMENFDVGSTTPTEPKIGQNTMRHMQDMATLSSEEEQLLSEGKKNLPDFQSVEKVVANSTKQKLRVGVVVVSKDATNTVDGDSSSRHKMLKLNSRNDVCKSRDNHKDSTEGKSERASGGGPTGSAFDGSNVKVRGGRQSVAGNLVETPVKDAVQVGSHVTENALALEDEDPWVFCEICEKWRRLPYEINPVDLPDVWLCSMQYWLPGMNRCEISVEETNKAFYALYEFPPYGTSSGVPSENIQCFEQNHQNFHTESSRRRKKNVFKDVEKSSSRCALIHSSNFTNNQQLEPVKSRNLIDTNQLYSDSNLRRRPNFDNSHKSHKLAAIQPAPDRKENHLIEAEMQQVKIKTKREVNHLGFGPAYKKMRTENISYDSKCWGSYLDVENVDAKLRSGHSAKASEKNAGEFNGYSFADDVKSDDKEILVKCGEQAQLSSDGGSLDMRTGDGISMRKRKSDWLGNQNGHVSNTHAERGATGSRREKKLTVPKSFAKEFSRDNSVHKSNRNSSIACNLITSSDARPVDGKVVLRIVNTNGQSWKPRNELVSHTLDGINSLRKDLGTDQFSASATSGLSKVLGSVKTRGMSDNVKASPVESVSSSPLRIPLERPTLAGMDISDKDNTIITGLPFVGGEPRGCWDVRVENKINQSETGLVNKEKVCGGSDPESLNSLPLDYRDRDANNKHDGRTKYYLVRCETEIMEHNQLPCDSLATMGSYEEDMVEKRLVKVLSLQMNGNSLQDNGKTLTLDLDRDKKKVSGHVSELGGFYAKVNARHNSEVDPKSLTPVDKKVNTKQPVPDKSVIKSSEHKKQHALKNDSILKDNGMQSQLKLEEYSDSNANRFNAIKGESNCGTLNLISHFEGDDNKDCQNHKFKSGSLLGRTFDGCLANSCSTGDASVKPPGIAALKNGLRQGSGHCVPEPKGAKDLCGRCPGKISSLSVTASHVLKEAKKLQDLADSFKSKGFGFESNESYFHAAIKYLHGAFLLEICNSESPKQGEMSQVQVYSITAKLCEGCAQEYERHHEMGAAALAYKCMEVAYWRLVSCKTFIASRDRNELQASLQMISHGESPSSSASDVDNLNNQASVDRTTLSKGSVSHVSGNPITVARNNSIFLRLLDYTGDANFAIEASRKSQNAFVAANTVFDEPNHKDCVTSVKKVINFSFYDIDEFVHLVKLAMEAVNRSGFGGSRN